MQTNKISDRTLQIGMNRQDRIQISGVYVLPRILGETQIQEIIRLKELKCHHGNGGHGDDSHNSPLVEPDEDKKKKNQPKKKKEQEPDKKKTSSHLFRADKPHRLPWVADLINQHVPHLRIGTRSSYVVDENMQLYQLQEGGGIVPQHIDEDFVGPDGSLALCSIILYLSEGYIGGETVFRGNMFPPHVEMGGGLLFRHDIPHEGLAVLSGVKYVLKTDLFFR